VLQALPRLLVLIAILAACGKKSDPGKARDDAASAVAPVALPILGVDRITRFNFIYGEGSSAYSAAVKAKTRGWAAVREACELALKNDPMHLDAHRLLAVALAQTGESAAAADHLVTAIAADYYRYGPELASDPDLEAFRATPHGKAVAQLAQQIAAEYERRIKGALWLVGRRSTFKWPEKEGVQPATSRGELYAYDRETKRYFRLTHTDHQVAGFVRAASGGEVALLGFDRIDHAKGDEAPPLLARAWLEIVDTREWKPAGPHVVLPAAREVAVGYGAGDQLLVSTAPAAGRWGVGAPVVSSVDRTTGKLTKVGDAPPEPRIVLTIDEGHVVRVPDGVQGAWTGDPAAAPSLDTGGAKIAVPESGQAAQASIATAPGGARVAFATSVDPCAKDTAPSLYVADAMTGALKHLLTARSRFATRWIDATTLAYEDGDGAIRLWDATTGREAMRLDDRAGLALEVLSLAPGPLCKQAPPTAEPAGSGEEPMPPEEGSGGPVTTPQ